MKINAYSPETEAQMRNFYGSLSEKDRRRYAAVEAEKSGYGGITYICGVLHCDIDRVRRGTEELKQPLPEKEERTADRAAVADLFYRPHPALMKHFWRY
jgi:hypothetical protein